VLPGAREISEESFEELIRTHNNEVDVYVKCKYINYILRRYSEDSDGGRKTMSTLINSVGTKLHRCTYTLIYTLTIHSNPAETTPDISRLLFCKVTHKLATRQLQLCFAI